MAETPQRMILQGWCSLLAPVGWAWMEEGGVTTLYPAEAEGSGAINLSLFFRHDDEPASQAELAEQALKFGRNLGARLHPELVTRAELDSTPASYLECADDAGDFWRVWHTARDRRLILLTYNGPAGEAESEHALVDRIVNSFRWEAPPEPHDA